jgi:RNA polymerase sigma-70 factor (ECF subfamily)
VDALVETLVSKAATAPDIEESLDVGAALGRLPHDMRVLVLLRYYANLTSREIGSVMGIPSATVRFRLAIARRQLKKLLDASTASTPISDEVRTRA